MKMPLAENPNSDSVWSSKLPNRVWDAATEAQRQLAHDLGYRKVPSEEEIMKEIYDRTPLNSHESTVAAIVVYAMLMEMDETA